MTLSESNKIIDRLTDGCSYNRFDDPGVQQEYQRALMKYGYTQMNAAVDAVLENDSKNVPPISALIKACREHKTSGTVVNTEHCEVCDDKGYAFMTEQYKISDNLSIPYQYALYCPFCQIGLSQAYNGTNCKEKSFYIVPPLTQYFDDYAVEQMRQANRNKKTAKHEIPQFGRDMPGLKWWEKSDADDSDFVGEG